MAKIGYEVEGRLRGVLSLFLSVDEVHKLKDPKNAQILQKVSQVAVYDDNSKISMKEIEILMSLDERLYLTLETPMVNIDFGVLPARINTVLVMSHPQIFDLFPFDQIKFVSPSKFVLMVTKEAMGVTTPDEFDCDTEVDL